MLHGIDVERPELADAASKALFSTCSPPATFSVPSRRQINFRFLLNVGLVVVEVGGGEEGEGGEGGLVPLQLLVFRHAPSLTSGPMSSAPKNGEVNSIFSLKLVCF